MTKRELLKTPEIKITSQIQKAMAMKDTYYKAERYTYRMAIRVNKIRGENILKVAVFFPENSDPVYYIFLDLDKEKYCTWDIEKKRWHTAMIDYLSDYVAHSTWWGRRCYSSESTDGIIKAMLRTDDKEAFYGIKTWQQAIVDREREARKQKERNRIKKIMSFVKPTPKNFEDWANHQGEQYIFYDYSKKVKTGWCTYCEDFVEIKNPKHRKESRCRKCKKKITFICNSRKSTILTKHKIVYLIQNYKDGIISRAFSLNKKLSSKSKEIYLYEFGRRIITDHEAEFNKDQGEWKEGALSQYSGYYWHENAPQYLDHITSGMKKLKSSYLLTDRSIPVYAYVSKERKWPIIEKCAKAGLTRLANELINTYQAKYVIDSMENGELAKMLGIDKMRMKRLRDMKGGWRLLEWLQKEKEVNTVWDDRMLFELSVWNIKPEEMELILSRVPFAKAHNYIVKQAKLDNSSVEQALQTYEDYISMAISLKMDMTKEIIYLPKDLRAAHNRCIDLRSKEKAEAEAKKLKKKWPKVEKNLKGMERYEWSDGKYCIVSPKTILDIYREGMVLGHCLHTCDIYWERITNKTTFLMFLRKKDAPDTPWYTLEVEPGGNIRQKRTVGDNQNPDLKDAMPFLKKWQKHIQKIMNEEDKKLAEASNKQRLENYSEIRKEQKKVWHGKLQGQLLADVLEADFMAAV